LPADLGQPLRWIGGLDGVPISRIQAWLWRVWRSLVNCLTSAGIDIPEDLMASLVEGDDELPWPTERLRYHWSIPKLAEEDWPRERMPPEVADLLAERFASLRSRDHLD
jgi:hypothetical protein